MLRRLKTIKAKKKGTVISSPVPLGGVISRVLGIVGITDDRVTRWLGAPCGCKRRRDKLNRASDIAWSYLRGKIDATQAREEFVKLVEGGETKPQVEEASPPEEGNV